MTNARFAILPVTLSSKKVGPGSVFVAIQGARENGAQYIPEALERGAREIIIARDAHLDATTRALCTAQGVPIAPVDNVRKSLAERAAAAHNHPAQNLTCIGITGTKGKTTTAWLTHHILTHAGHKTALLSTVENRIGATRYPTDLTTPQADYIQAFLRTCVDEGVTHVVIEVAAQALTHHRVDHIPFTSAAWLNFSQEHGEFYPHEHDYWNAKAQLFDAVITGGTIIIPSDDARFATLKLRNDVNALALAPQTAPIIDPASLQSPLVSCEFQGITYTCPQLLGSYNATNVLAAVMLAHSVGVGSEQCQQTLQTFAGVPGRLNWYHLRNGARVCIDYAHNPASFEAILGSLRAYTHELIVVFGAGGERDAARRPKMGAVAAQYADTILLTTDNPRSEEPAQICRDIIAGIDTLIHDKIVCELDREQAIRRACAQASPGAIIAVLGKGPDEYQLVHGVKTFFSERAIVQSLS